MFAFKFFQESEILTSYHASVVCKAAKFYQPDCSSHLDLDVMLCAS
jgi:hypothetical protein